MINIEATKRFKGYNPNDLSAGSNKKVWANCDICGIGRWVYFYAYRDLCNSCVRMGENNFMFGKPVSEETCEKIRQGNLNKHPSEKSRLKMSKAQLGKKLSEEHIQNISKSKMGKKNGRWNGGNKLRNARSQAKRKQFGFIPLNECLVDGWVGHHLDLNYVIYIPEELHKSIWHSVTKDINMNIINDGVYEWFINEYFQKVI